MICNCLKDYVAIREAYMLRLKVTTKFGTTIDWSF